MTTNYDSSVVRKKLSARLGKPHFLQKAYVFDGSTGNITEEFPSKQIDDQFSGVPSYGELIKPPPYSFEQLISLSESHPTHAAALEQKAADVIADGFHVSLRKEYESDANIDTDEAKNVIEWWEGLFDEFTSTETLLAMWEDYEITGWGLLEVVRDVDNVVRRLIHIPSYTMRVTEDGYRFVQIRDGQTVWFKRWGLGKDFQIMANSGRKAAENAKFENLANEVLVFRKPSRVSHWYGTPMYISSMGFILLALAARNFNIRFFENFREPRHLIMVSGLEQDVDTVMREMVDTWQQQLKDNPHSNVILPIHGTDVEIQIEQMATDQNDFHFTEMLELADTEIMISHRMPPDRLGVVKRGLLGGDVTHMMNQIYKSGVVDRSQSLLETRLQKFVEAEFAGGERMKHHVDFMDLDIADFEMDVEQATSLVGDNMITINEGRVIIGREPSDLFRFKGTDLTSEQYGDFASKLFEEEGEEGEGDGEFGRFRYEPRSRNKKSKNQLVKANQDLALPRNHRHRRANRLLSQ